MAVFRVGKSKNYTVMSNHHLRNKNLSLKAKGLLTLMLSLPDSWDYTTKGLAAICKEGVDGISAALNELENQGYLIRERKRNSKGQLTIVEYTILEEPVLADAEQEKPELEIPKRDNPEQGNLVQDEPVQEKPEQVNPVQLSTKELNKELNKNLSINREKKENEIDKMDETAVYREIIKENIEYEILCQRYQANRVDEIVELMLDVVCGERKTIRISGADYPKDFVKGRLLKLDSSRVEYAFECLDKNTCKVHNIRAYLLATLYNAAVTMDEYYRAEVRHDLYGG